MMVGDSIADIKLGRNSKCGATVIVKTGNYSNNDFLKEAEYVIDSIDDLYDMF